MSCNLAVIGRYDVVSHVNFGFLQMLLWERFGALTPKPMRCPATVPSETGEVVGATGAKNVYIDHVLWWTGMKQLSGKSLVKLIEKEENFNFRQYTFVPTRIQRVQIILELSSKIFLVSKYSRFSRSKAQFFFGVVAPTLLSVRLEYRKGTTTFNPQPVM